MQQPFAEIDFRELQGHIVRIRVEQRRDRVRIQHHPPGLRIDTPPPVGSQARFNR